MFILILKIIMDVLNIEIVIFLMIHLLLITIKNEKVYQLTMIWIMRCSRREKSKITVKEQYYIIRKEINIKTFRDATRCRWN